MTFSLQSFNVYYLGAAIALAGIGAYVLMADRGERDPASLPSAGVETEFPGRLPEPTVSGPLNKEVREISPEDEPIESNRSEPDLNRKKGVPEEDKDNLQPDPYPSLRKPDRQTGPVPEREDPSGTGKKSETLPVSAGFEADVLSGCSPLAVGFVNLSLNAVEYTWTFGDGGSSAEKDPSYVFDEPGQYSVQLRIRGASGSEDIARQSIRVYETPEALFEMDDDVDLSGRQPVYFYNYSRGADFYEWDFGDQQRSSLTEPVHYYGGPGNYDVKLKVWTANQCYDSLTVLNAFAGGENEIRFPTAFTPNMNGPVGGYYDVNDISNTVFHPFVSGEITEYQLRIFNRQGLLLFESKDVTVGWDGYYQETLAPQAVYIWKARGKFGNGKTFLKSGDVTLIRQY